MSGSYTYSTGESGLAATVAINTGTSGSPIWTTTVEQITDVTLSGYEIKFVDSTNLESTVEEKQPVIVVPGTFKCTCIRVPVAEAPGQAAVNTAFLLGAAQTPTEFKLTVSKNALAGQTTAGDSWVFSAYVGSFIPTASISPEKLIMSEFTLEVVTPYVATAGS
jgi:hypothetical protein